jgi:CBS domain-containing protein/sporulation protein YlmC with PRC-barrel domain
LEATLPDQCYLSALLFTKVYSAERRVLGKTIDLRLDLELPQPEVVGLLYRPAWSRETWSVPWSEVDSVASTAIVLKPGVLPAKFVAEEVRPSSEILLRDFLLDKQIVDVHGAKVERVNDLLFVRTNGKLKLAQVDVGFRGLLRRLGFEGPVSRFWKWFFDYTLQEKFIAWQFVQPLADRDRLKLQIPQSKLAELHPADLADIIEDMDVHERAAVVESLNEEILAEALEEMDPKVQVSIMRGLEPEKAADILEEMSPDEAADLIADLPTQTAKDIFDEMDHKYQQTVKGLLEHDEDEAGGLMTTQFMALSPDKTIVDALAFIKQHADLVDVIYYIYVVDSEGRLLGVVNLRELLSDEIFTPLERIMTARMITAKIDDDAKDLANLFAKYGFRGIPVVDDENRIQGVIRFKALLEILAPHLGK